jgi:hypothetical protein
MQRWFDRWLCPTSPLRVVLDLLWIGGFVVVLALMVVRAGVIGPFRSGVELSLMPGTQRRGLYREGRRIGQIMHRVERRERGWKIVEQFSSGSISLGQAELSLRRDLSLRAIRIDIDLSALATVHAQVGQLIQLLGGDGRLELAGGCSSSSGECLFRGKIGSRPITHGMAAGRGPVLPSAVYPLLARGVLGKRVELNLIDPMSLQRRTVSFTVVGRRELRLGETRHDALLVQQRFSGIESEIWLDRGGRLLKETLPMGLSLEHEAWFEPGAAPPHRREGAP